MVGEGDGVILIFIFTNQVVFENEIVEARVSEDTEGVMGSADYGLTMEIERGIEEGGDASELGKFVNDLIITGIVFRG